MDFPGIGTMPAELPTAIRKRKKVPAQRNISINETDLVSGLDIDESLITTTRKKKKKTVKRKISPDAELLPPDQQPSPSVKKKKKKLVLNEVPADEQELFTSILEGTIQQLAG